MKAEPTLPLPDWRELFNGIIYIFYSGNVAQRLTIDWKSSWTQLGSISSSDNGGCCCGGAGWSDISGGWIYCVGDMKSTLSRDTLAHWVDVMAAVRVSQSVQESLLFFGGRNTEAMQLTHFF